MSMIPNKMDDDLKVLTISGAVTTVLVLLWLLAKPIMRLIHG